MNAKEMDVNVLIPYENNPRINDHAVDAVAKSIREFGFLQPVVVDRNNVVVIGHTRLKAAVKLGMKTVPTVVADDLTDAEVNALRIADNRSAEFAQWDESKLEMEYARLVQNGEVDMDGYGFDIDVDAVLARLDGALAEDIIRDGGELDLDDFGDEQFKYHCPKCGMKFN